jgi:hypothetical protein
MKIFIPPIFFYLHSQFYSLLEREIVDLVLKIVDFGHDVGLHFEPGYYGGNLITSEQLEEKLILEKELLQNLIQQKIRAFSFHNPDTGNWLEIDQDEIAGLINTYGGYIRNNFHYVSDSNGYWRFHRLRDVLETAINDKLQVLTHPCWWTPDAMSPQDRIRRCIHGRATKTEVCYNQLLSDCGRKNIGVRDSNGEKKE